MTADELNAKLARRQAILNPPESDTFIWRYYSLDKFLILLTSGQLFFAKSSSFEDPFEGDYGAAAKQKIRDQYGDGQYLRDFNTFDFFRQYTYISCWHENQHESDAMWKLYGNAIAVKAKFSSISNLLSWSETEIKQSGRVSYIDYGIEHVSVESSYIPYFFKRLSFAHEREVRFLIQEHRDDWNAYPPPVPGKLAPLNINSDFEEIVLSPTMEPHVANAIERVVRQANVSIPVRRSTLLNSPVW
ncbi:hypothetical protein [Zobellella iuensis]|uniref:DUF2971 domain-containing protein n=1 Tax=Zobellella iuensis TaxID=2803811 RepID=A0ABS1QT47_9GAMM|nr:hypothetical protein [Zobellella iuensis]MBL1378015.1 hypothetical protein [Zobellella iuensis]